MTKRIEYLKTPIEEREQRSKEGREQNAQGGILTAVKFAFRHRQLRFLIIACCCFYFASLERDFNHPAIIGWCPFNETWDYEGRRQDDSLLANVYKMTKLYDTTRPCIDTSGNYHVVTDIYDLHNYEQDPAKFAATYESFKQGGDLEDTHGYRQTPVKGIPTFISEYGGIKWDEEGVEKDGWGYGAGPATKEEFLNRYKGLTDALLDNPHMFAFCYTQLYDVEQELNGLYTYERKHKFDMDVIKAINARKAAIED